MIRIMCFPCEERVEQAVDFARVTELIQDPHNLVWVDFWGEVHDAIEPILKTTFGLRVIVAGLDTDFRGEPFGPMPALMAKAEHVDKLQAICMVCGEPHLVRNESSTVNQPDMMNRWLS